MIDQERMETVAESETLAQSLDATEAPTAQAVVGNAEAPELATEAQVQSADEVQTEAATETEAAVVVEAEAPTDAEAEAAVVVEAEAPTDVEAEAAVVVEAEAPTDAEAEAAVVVEAEAPTDVEANVKAEEGASAPDVADAETEAAGASFTPVEEEGARPRRLKDLEVGMELEGRVTSIALYGVFVDVGVGRDGLVHISEMSDTRIESPSDVVQTNDVVHVRVKGVDPEARRISLTMRSQRTNNTANRARAKRADVDREALASLKVGDIVEGAITGMAPFGAFADIGVGKDGLIHISELSEGRVDKPEDAVKAGERYSFKILEVDPEGTRISLSLRRALRAQRLQQLEPGQILEGAVSGLAPFGAFVDIGVGRDGLVHISALSEERVEKVEDAVKVGDKVTVRVLEVDAQSKRISLTMRLKDPEPEVAPEEPSETTTAESDVLPRTGPGAMARFAGVTAAREDSRRKESREERRRGRGNRSAASAEPATPDIYSVGDDTDDEEFEGNATLEDLLTKFGGPSSRRNRERRRGEYNNEEEYDEDDRFSRRQRDAIRRTLEQVSQDD